jgi:hypothetical protein
MKKLLLGLAALFTAGAVMAADTATLTFATYYAPANSLKILASDGSTVNGVNGWMAALMNEAGAPVMGYKVGSGSTDPIAVVAKYSDIAAAAGFALAQGDWSLKGYESAKSYQFMIGSYYDPTGTLGFAGAGIKGTFGPYSATLGGTDQSPPAPAGKFAFGGAQQGTVVVPEPSVFALGLLGLGAFLIRRRS